MDAIVGTASTAASTSEGVYELGGLETLIGAAIALVIFRFELERSVGSLDSMQCCKWLMKQCALEVLLLGIVGVAAVGLRMRGDISAEQDARDAEAWEQIKSDWPLLVTADSLLVLQVMLRTAILVSAVLRRGEQASPLAGHSACLLLAAGAARALIAARTDAYCLEGPLGYSVPWALELAVLPLLLVLCKGLPRQDLLASSALAGVAAWIASSNHLALSDDKLSDICFTTAHLLELFSGMAFVFRTLLDVTSDKGMRASVAMGFLYVLLPLQQSLSAYYFLEAFTPVESLVGAGQPFQLLQYGNAASLGAYIGALTLYVTAAEMADSRQQASPVPSAVPQAQQAPRPAGITAAARQVEVL